MPLIDENSRSKKRKAELKAEHKSRRHTNYQPAEMIHYNEHSTVERINGRLKDEFGVRMMRVRGGVRHLIFGIIVSTVDQLMKFVE